MNITKLAKIHKKIKKNFLYCGYNNWINRYDIKPIIYNNNQINEYIQDLGLINTQYIIDQHITLKIMSDIWLVIPCNQYVRTLLSNPLHIKDDTYPNNRYKYEDFYNLYDVTNNMDWKLLSRIFVQLYND